MSGGNEIRVLIIEPDETMRVERVPTGYPEMNNALFDGGLVQVLYGRERDSGDRVALLFDEEGKYKNLQANMPAFLAWELFLCDGAHLMQGDMLVGRVAICGVESDSSTDPTFVDVPDSVCPVQKLNTEEEKN